MMLFSSACDPWSHRTRIVLAEKSIEYRTIDVRDGQPPEDLLDLNPYQSVPTLVDRELPSQAQNISKYANLIFRAWHSVRVCLAQSAT